MTSHVLLLSPKPNRSFAKETYNTEDDEPEDTHHYAPELHRNCWDPQPTLQHHLIGRL